MKRNTNKLGFGFLLAAIIPLIVFLVIFFASHSGISLIDYLKSLWQLGAIIKIMSLCVLPNLGLFLYFYRIKYDLAARGVLLATFMYAFVVMFSKVF